MADDDRDDDQLDDAPDDQDAANGADRDDDGQGTDQLGDAGKQALDRMKAQRNAARDELRAFKALGLSPDEIKTIQQGRKPDPAKDDAPDPDEIRRQARAEARTEAARERVVDKIEAKAARAFADPEDAVAILLRSRPADDFLDGDKIDVGEIEDALTELLEKKPHLAAAQGDQRRFRGGADQGPRKEKPPTLGEQITAAEKAGDVRTAMALKAKQLTLATSDF